MTIIKISANMSSKMKSIFCSYTLVNYNAWANHLIGIAS